MTDVIISNFVNGIVMLVYLNTDIKNANFSREFSRLGLINIGYQFDEKLAACLILCSTNKI